jgi:DEAD/DEAH box helicase domain-containing protein
MYICIVAATEPTLGENMDSLYISKALAAWQQNGNARHFCCHERLAAENAQNADLPEWVHPTLVAGLKEKGIVQLYAHQRQSCDATAAGEHVVIATPTASGKTLCYNLPVFDRLIRDPDARALYLFPTKALARDQIAAARDLAGLSATKVGVAVYDGDTPPDHRRAARRQARILATNPEMLHTGILPHHPNWAEFFSGLTYIVIDELHTYRGVFGSHLANVMRRLLRVAQFHGANPKMIACSATIANPRELAGQIFGRKATLIEESGAPQGERNFLIYNPPLIDAALGIRESYLKATCKLTLELFRQSCSTLVFCRSRLAVEVLLRYLRDGIDRLPVDIADAPEKERMKASIRSYRGGYLPKRRREVERAMRSGETSVVVTTSALELGIDIGDLDAVVMAGWPGSRAATWQRSGRAGRRQRPSLTLMVASSEPMDQYVTRQPDFLFGQAPEHARIDPDNPSILIPQLKCAAYELPFTHHESFGSLDQQETAEVLKCLAEANVLHQSSEGYHFVDDAFPANEVGLRGSLNENFIVVSETGHVLAEVDYHDAPNVLHDHAIYQIEGEQYLVERLDHGTHKAYVQHVDIDYYTDAMTYEKVRILEPLEHADAATYGEIHVLERVVGFKKIKLHTHENIGYGDVSQPEREKHTTSIWLTLDEHRVQQLGKTAAEIAEATLAAAYALHSTAALLLMSDGRDLGRAVGDVRSESFGVTSGNSRGKYSTAEGGADLIHGPAPTIFIYDQYPGGTGLASRLFDERAQLLSRATQMIKGCPCKNGCPACIAPGSRKETKALALLLLDLWQHKPNVPYVPPKNDSPQNSQRMVP